MLQISITIYITFSQGIEKASKERPKREHRDFNAVEAETQAKEEKIKHISTRKLIGPNEDVYIMDAKSIGNDKSNLIFVIKLTSKNFNLIDTDILMYV